MIDTNKRTLRLIDFGLADFYKPGEKLNHRVAAMYFKSPELLLGVDTYDYSIDMWAFGVCLASLLFKKNPFFSGTDSLSMLQKIAQLLGSEDLFAWIESKQISVQDLASVKSIVGAKVQAKDASHYEKMKDTKNSHLFSEDGVDLMLKCL